MNIGNVYIKNNIFLAPMAGVTDMPFRRICKEFGAGLLYSEMISSRGLFYKDKKTEFLMKFEETERPFAIQLFGNEPDIMAYAAKEVTELCEPDIIDINMGCPAPKIVSNNDGSALMKNPVLAGKIIEAVSMAVDIPVTVKFRKGWDENSVNAVEFGHIVQESGAAAVCIHGRTRQQFYSGKSDFNIIREVKENLKIPVIGNGDIIFPKDAERMFNETHCDAVMIGRGACGNPWIFSQINEYLNFGTYRENSVKEKIDTAKCHLLDICKYKGEYIGIKESRKHLSWYIKGMHDASFYKNLINRTEKLEDMITILDKIVLCSRGESQDE